VVTTRRGRRGAPFRSLQEGDEDTAGGRRAWAEITAATGMQSDSVRGIVGKTVTEAPR